MKKILQLLVLATAFSAFSTYAKEKIIPLEDDTLIRGKWKLTAEAAARHKTKTPLSITWDFKKNGVLNTEATDARNRTGAMNINVKYSVENGVIRKQFKPGIEKYETCSVVDFDNTTMILHCKFLYYFMERS